jgi:hypothetical protein
MNISGCLYDTNHDKDSPDFKKIEEVCDASVQRWVLVCDTMWPDMMYDVTKDRCLKQFIETDYYDYIPVFLKPKEQYVTPLPMRTFMFIGLNMLDPRMTRKVIKLFESKEHQESKEEILKRIT